ncbi:MAG TPA: type II secretion system F family protein [Bryobacteraceae bacterium]|nr:type II secretion system F family protein [Bryobacteraceae bacterium]
MTLFIVIVLVFWAVSLGAYFLLSRWFRSSDADKIKNRLMGTAKTAEKSETSKVALFDVEEQPKGQIIPKLMKQFNLAVKSQQLLEQAGLKWHPVRLAHFCLIGFLAGYVLAFLFLPAEMRRFALLAALVFGAAPLLYVMRLRSTRLKAFEEVFPDTLEFISRSMRAGHAFSVSLEMIHREFPEPLSGEFRRTFEEHNLGLPLDVALQGLSARIPLLDVHFFVSAVLLQKRTGGNLAEILDKLAYVIRERFKLRGRIRAISAHGKMTGLALTCIPLGVAIIMFFVNPDYVTFFFEDEVGNTMLGLAVGFQVLGYIIIKKIVSIEV